MKRVIKAFGKFQEIAQEEIYDAYLNGELERANFPYLGEMAEGVIFVVEDETTYLIPVSTIRNSKFSSVSDDDDDESGSSDSVSMDEVDDLDEDSDDEE